MVLVYLTARLSICFEMVINIPCMEHTGLDDQTLELTL